MTRKEVLMAAFEAVLDAEEETGYHIWFDYAPHVDGFTVYTVNTKRFPEDLAYKHVYLTEIAQDINETSLDALRWRLRKEELDKQRRDPHGRLV